MGEEEADPSWKLDWQSDGPEQSPRNERGVGDIIIRRGLLLMGTCFLWGILLLSVEFSTGFMVSSAPTEVT